MRGLTLCCIKKEDEWADLRRGWYAGGEDFRNKLSRLIERAIGGKRRESFGGEETKERGERYAAEVLAKCLEKLEMGIEELKSLRKNDARKQAVEAAGSVRAPHNFFDL